MYSEDDLLPLSGLQHLVFCERQWGLIHIEQQWEENRLTTEGRILHERVHEAGTEARPGVVTARGLHLRSFQLGLSGQADVVEFHLAEPGAAGAAQLPDRKGWWWTRNWWSGSPLGSACRGGNWSGEAFRSGVRKWWIWGFGHWTETAICFTGPGRTTGSFWDT